MSSLVTFRIGERDYAADLGTVREVVRLAGLADLPGMTPPLAGVLDLRGTALPVLDLRRAGAGPGGDVLVVQRGEGSVGVAVDAALEVVARDSLPPAGGSSDGVLPAYVLQVLRGADGPVFLVDLEQMLGPQT